MINERDIKINKISDDNNFVKKNNVNSTNICNDLNNKVEVYKKHILTITEQNAKLSQELENILSRDDQVIYQLNRAEYLRHVEEENKNIINASLDSLKKHLNKFGNMGNRLDKSNVIKINSMNNSLSNKTYSGKFNNRINDINASNSNIDVINVNKSINMNNNVIDNNKKLNNISNGNRIQNSNNFDNKKTINMNNINNQSNSLQNSNEVFNSQNIPNNNLNENLDEKNNQYFENKDNQIYSGEEEQQYSGNEEEQVHYNEQEQEQYNEEEQYNGEEQEQYNEEEQQYNEEEQQYSGGEEGQCTGEGDGEENQ